jgi:hypothetical protein
MMPMRMRRKARGLAKVENSTALQPCKRFCQHILTIQVTLPRLCEHWQRDSKRSGTAAPQGESIRDQQLDQATPVTPAMPREERNGDREHDEILIEHVGGRERRRGRKARRLQFESGIAVSEPAEGSRRHRDREEERRVMPTVKRHRAVAELGLLGGVLPRRLKASAGRPC